MEGAGRLVGVKAELGDLYPACAGDLTQEIAFGLQVAESMFTLDQMAKGESGATA